MSDTGERITIDPPFTFVTTGEYIPSAVRGGGFAGVHIRRREALLPYRSTSGRGPIILCARMLCGRLFSADYGVDDSAAAMPTDDLCKVCVRSYRARQGRGGDQ
jgi:hypothetical protein